MAQSPVASLLDGFVRTASLPKSKSVGNYVGPIGKLGNRCWEAKEAMKTSFYNHIRPGILQHLDGLFGSVSTRDTINVTLYMIGRRSNTAAPTVLFVSENESNRKDARKLIKESGILRQHRGWKTAEASKDPGWGARLEQLASGLGPKRTASVSEPVTQVLYHPLQPLQSQGMILYARHEASLRKMTANLIRHNGKAFFLAPAHAFFENDDRTLPECDDSNDDFDIDSDDETATMVAPGAVHDSHAVEVDCDDSDVWSSSDSSDDSDMFSVQESSSELLSQTSLSSFGNDAAVYPGLDDPIPLHPTRAKFQTPTREPQPPPAGELAPCGVLLHWSIDKDWALIEIRSDSDPNLEAFLDAEREDLSAKSVAGCSPAGAAIVTHTASNGEVTGVMSSTPSDIRLPRGSCFQEVYSIRLDAALADGDCGSAIFDAITGELYGNLVAGCRSSGFAYVMPAHRVMPELFKAIDSTEVLATEAGATIAADGKHGEALESVIASLPVYLTSSQWTGKPKNLHEHEIEHFGTLGPRCSVAPRLPDAVRWSGGLDDDSHHETAFSDDFAGACFPDPGTHTQIDSGRGIKMHFDPWGPALNDGFPYDVSDPMLEQSVVFDGRDPALEVASNFADSSKPAESAESQRLSLHEVTAGNLAKLQREYEEYSDLDDTLSCPFCDAKFTGNYRKGNLARHARRKPRSKDGLHGDCRSDVRRPEHIPHGPDGYCGHGGYHDAGDCSEHDCHHHRCMLGEPALDKFSASRARWTSVEATGDDGCAFWA